MSSFSIQFTPADGKRQEGMENLKGICGHDKRMNEKFMNKFQIYGTIHLKGWIMKTLLDYVSTVTVRFS